MKQIFQLRETNRTVQNHANFISLFPKSIRLVMVKKYRDIMGLKSGTSNRFMSRLVKILKLSMRL